MSFLILRKTNQNINRMNLYPLKFKPIYKDKIWGGNKLSKLLNKDKSIKNLGESWEISGVQDNVSVVANGILAENTLEELIEIYMGELVGEKNYQQFGLEFPLLIKFIDAQDDLSIQVHPNDKLSMERHKAYGKTELWYVIDADENAKLVSGFSTDADKEIYTRELKNNNLESLLNYETVKAGDVFFIPAGRVHAIGKGIVVAEIQQTSDVTYRIYDYNRPGQDGKPRELHTDLAIDAIDFSRQAKYKTDYELKSNASTQIEKCRYFTINLLEFDALMDKDYQLLDSFKIYICIEGEFAVKTEDDTIKVEKGETVLIPASISKLKLLPKGKSKLLEVYV